MNDTSPKPNPRNRALHKLAKKMERQYFEQKFNRDGTRTAMPITYDKGHPTNP